MGFQQRQWGPGVGSGREESPSEQQSLLPIELEAIHFGLEKRWQAAALQGRLARFWRRDYNEVLTSVRSWRNWQTHQLEGLAVAIPWWFESTRPHQNFRKIFLPAGFELLEAPAIISEWLCNFLKLKFACS